AAVIWIDPVASARSCADSATTRAVYRVRVIAGLVEPEGVVLSQECQTRQGLNRTCQPDVMDVLQRKEIHVAVELVVRGEQIFERLVFVIARVAIAGAEIVFDTKTRCERRIGKRVADAGENGVGEMFEAAAALGQ